jgi:hypothetical protein
MIISVLRECRSATPYSRPINLTRFHKILQKKNWQLPKAVINYTRDITTITTGLLGIISEKESWQTEICTLTVPTEAVARR